MYPRLRMSAPGSIGCWAVVVNWGSPYVARMLQRQRVPNLTGPARVELDVKYQLALRTAEPSDHPVSATANEPPVALIEELTLSGELVGAGRTDRRLTVAFACMIAIVGIGLGSRWTGSEPAAGAPSPRPITQIASEQPTPQEPVLGSITPAEGGSVVGGIVEVGGIAREPLGIVHLSVVLGDAVLGWTNTAISAAGPVHLAIPVFAPPFDGSVELRISVRSGGVDRPPDIIRRFHLRSDHPVGIWSALLDQTTADPVVIVFGLFRFCLCLFLVILLLAV